MSSIAYFNQKHFDATIEKFQQEVIKSSNKPRRQRQPIYYYSYNKNKCKCNAKHTGKILFRTIAKKNDIS